MVTCQACGMEYADAGGALACPRCGARGPTPEITQEEAGWYRLRGIILVILGAGVGYLAILRPLQEAAEQQRWVSLWTWGVWFAPLMLLGGLFYCVAPRHAYQLLGRRRITSSGVIAAIVILAVSFTVSQALRTKLEGMGYVDERVSRTR